MHVKSPKCNFCRLAFVAALLCAVSAPAGAQAQGARDRVAQLERAAALIGANRLAEAEQQLNGVLQVAPEEAGALNLLGAVRARQGRLDEAEALFSRAVRRDGGLAGARMNLAYLYLLRGDPEKSAAELREVLRLEPANADAVYRLAWLLVSRGRFDEGISLVEGLQGTPPPALLALLGDAHMGKGDAGRAEAIYLRALAGQADQPDALIGLARVSQARGDAKTAAIHISRARVVSDNSPDLLSKLARVALDSDLRGEAAAALKRAAELRPAEPSYHFALGAAWLRPQPDLQQAEQSFRQFAALRPGDAQGHLHLGYVLLKQKKHAEARGWLEKSVRNGAGTPEAFYYLGLIAQGQGEDARAVELFGQAVRAAPAFAHAHVALGATYLKLKDYPRAQQSLETGAKLSPDDAKAHYNLAMLYARLKNPERAREEMNIVERLKGEGRAQDAEGETIAPPPPPPG